ncbi:MAG: TIGR03013 family PEP-CTERM/XrtA system glycosyltransferase [Gammaproteobacteria bacterium]|nr:MAG: TIGR03013 family PEP-CTERM/XrtA system glycosyltransferase [Gammaproteobacteria bacterium]
MPVLRIFRHYIPAAFVFLGLMEAIVFILSFRAAVFIRFSSNSAAVAEHVGPLWPKSITFALVMLLSMIGLGLYDRLSCTWEGRSAMVLRILTSFLFSVFPLSFIFYVVPAVSVWRGPALLAFGISLIAVTSMRLIFFRVVDQKLFKRRVLVLGAGKNACEISKLEDKPALHGICVVGYVHMSRDHDVVESGRVIYPDCTLRDIVRENQVDEIVVALDDRRKSLPVHEILDCKMDGVAVLDLLTFFERETGKVRLELVNPSWLFLSDGFRISNVSLALKRGLDILISLLLLPLFLPVMLIVMVAIWLESPSEGTIVYKQTRVGSGDKEFQIYKFRSMYANAEENGLAQWTKKHDARVTRVGAVIRKIRLDELPQLFNVIKGDMSFVGPRPERPEFVKQLVEQYPYYRERHRMRPGLTGWAQIRYEYGDTFEGAFEKLQYDLYYVKNSSIFLDLLIIIHTVEVILLGKGAH